MNFNKYQEQCAITGQYGEGSKIIYPSLGLASEAGEVVGKVKKVLRDNNGEFTPELCEGIAYEIGDTLWYCAMLARDIGYSFEDIAKMNIAKLEDRKKRNVIYGSGDYR